MGLGALVAFAAIAAPVNASVVSYSLACSATCLKPQSEVADTTNSECLGLWYDHVTWFRL